jgi:hypothetical protein
LSNTPSRDDATMVTFAHADAGVARACTSLYAEPVADMRSWNANDDGV